MTSTLTCIDVIGNWSAESQEIFRLLAGDQRACLDEYGAVLYPVHLPSRKRPRQLRCGWSQKGGKRHYHYAQITGSPRAGSLRVELRVGADSGLIGASGKPLKPARTGGRTQKEIGYTDIRYGEPLPPEIFALLRAACRFTRNKHKIELNEDWPTEVGVPEAEPGSSG